MVPQPHVAADRFWKMPVFQVQHRTTYRYGAPVAFGEHHWMFRPRDSFEQRLISAEHSVSPAAAETSWRHDTFGNQWAVLDFDPAVRATELVFDSTITLEHTELGGPRFRATDRARTWPFEYESGSLVDLAPYRNVQYPDPVVAEWARDAASRGQTSTADVLLGVAEAVTSTCSYSRRTNPGTQSPAETLARKRGTCRDFALLMIEAARVLGLGARFVTGYIYVPARDADLIRGGGATHAWVQIFLPGAGWVEYDPTNGIEGTRDLIRVGVARDPRQARPLLGSFIGDRSVYLGMDVDVAVKKVSSPMRQPAHALPFVG
jgi:transglutaminase-like putative cysteine protease